MLFLWSNRFPKLSAQILAQPPKKTKTHYFRRKVRKSCRVTASSAELTKPADPGDEGKSHMGSAPDIRQHTSSATIMLRLKFNVENVASNIQRPYPHVIVADSVFSFAATLSTDHKFDGLPSDGLGEVLRSQWRKVSQDPHDTSGHEKFIARCQSVGHLPFAGHCYQRAYDAAEGMKIEGYLRPIANRSSHKQAFSCP